MSEVTGNPDPESQRQQFNAEGARLVEEKARQTRLDLIKYATRIVIWRAAEDKIALDSIEQLPQGENTTLGIHTTVDVLHGLVNDETVTETQTLKWTREDSLNQEGYKELVVYIPLDTQGKLPDIDVDESAQVEEAQLPDEIYLAITDQDDVVSRYVLAKDGIQQYISAGEAGEQEVFDELHPAIWQQRLRRRVDTGLPLTDQILEALINMDTVPQRTISTDPDQDPTDY